MQKNLQFTVDSALLRELGEKLVETVHLALSELVKNAYDADATEVDVVFETNEEGEARIRIEDNGTGMNFKAVEGYWMRIATAHKEEKDRSTIFGRHLTGAKGIGRFSCRRLGKKLTLITNGTAKGDVRGKQSNIQRTVVEFPWTKFEAGADVTKIKCPGEQTTVKKGITGTTLIIDGVTDEWGTRGLNWLKRHLAVLSANRGTKREGFKDDPGFMVMLTAPEFEGGVRDLREDLMNAGWGTISGKVDGKKRGKFKLEALGLGTRTITSTREFEHLQGVSVEIAVMVDERRQMRDTTILSKSTLKSILEEWGGVQVRYRGFRVAPYGDIDWLDIDKDRGLRKLKPDNELYVFAETIKGINAKRSLISMLSMKSYVGNVEIGEEAAGFEMKLNREGFIESLAVRELKEFVRYGIDWSTILRDYYLRQQELHKAEAAKIEFEDILDHQIDSGRVVEAAVDYIAKEVQSLKPSLDPEEAQKIEENFEKALKAIQTESVSTQSEISHYRIIASTATLVLIFSHEVKSFLGMLEQSKNSLNRISKHLSGSDKDEVNAISRGFSDLNKRLKELLELTSLVAIDQKKAKPTRVALRPRIRKAEAVLKLIMRKYKIELDHSEVPNNAVISKIREAEVYSILLNVLSNSIKAVIAGSKDRRIKISAEKDGEYIKISVKDSGIGLDKRLYDEVFIPFIADPDGTLYGNLDSNLNPEDNAIVGTGTGLGLGIVKAIVTTRGGSVNFVMPSKGWNTELQIRLK